MNVWNSLDSFPTGREPITRRSGTSTGFTSEHQTILASVDPFGPSALGASLLVSFDPHPLAVVAPSRGPKLLQTRRQKLELSKPRARRRPHPAVRP
jgi:riboflavin kinase/FMN adenylyltransferase